MEFLHVGGLWILAILINWGFIEYHNDWADTLEDHPFTYVLAPVTVLFVLGWELGRVAIMPLMGFYRIVTKIKEMK